MDYGKYKNKAEEKIAERGGICKIIRKIDEVYNPDTNSYDGKEIIINGRGVASNYSVKQIDGTLIKQGDRKLMCFLDEKPVIDDVLEFGNELWLVKDIKPLNIDGNTVIYYTLQLREK